MLRNPTRVRNYSLMIKLVGSPTNKRLSGFNINPDIKHHSLNFKLQKKNLKLKKKI